MDIRLSLIIMLRQRLWSIRVWLFGIFLALGLIAAFYLILALGAKLSITQQLLDREQTVARAGSSNIQSFFQLFGNSLVVLSRTDSISSPNSATIKDMDAFIKQWGSSGLVGGVVLTDKDGTVLFNSNTLGTHDTGQSLSDRDYFLWAKGNPAGDAYYVGRPVISKLGATKGQTIVPVATAVYKNNSFEGMVVASIRLSSLTENYLKLMKITKTTDTYLIDSQGSILYDSSSSGSVGSNLFELIPDIKNKTDLRQEGELQTSYIDPINGKKQDHLLAYSMISLGSRNWFIVTSSPFQEVVNLTIPAYTRQIFVLILVLLTILMVGVFSTRATKKETKKI